MKEGRSRQIKIIVQNRALGFAKVRGGEGQERAVMGYTYRGLSLCVSAGSLPYPPEIFSDQVDLHEQVCSQHLQTWSRRM